jgi:L-seryl-tRNA(Ser) seleniumtransferase
MTDGTDIYEEIGVPTVVNAAGTKTRVGGSLIRPGAVDAMVSAADAFVRLSELQERASDLIADVTGAEAGYVTSGGAAALALGTAAAIARDDPAIMERLPDTEGVANEVVMPRTHRTGYDHAIRTAGAQIVDVGTNDRHLGTGSADVEPWELDAAITENTAAVAHVQKPYGTPSLADVAEVAHANDVPVIVDAAAELPPVENLSTFVERGADLVAFSGGKAIRGPQTTGILAGRGDLVASAAAQHLDMHAADEVWTPGLIDADQFAGVPRQGIGRSMKVGKEELAGLIKALQLFVEDDHDENRRQWREQAKRIADALTASDRLSLDIDDGGKGVSPEVIVRVTDGDGGPTATDVTAALRREEPRVVVGADRLDESVLTINPMCLDQDEVDYVSKRVLAHVEDTE